MCALKVSVILIYNAKKKPDITLPLHPPKITQAPRWFQLSSRSHGCGIEPHMGLQAQQGIYLGFSLPIPPSSPTMLSLSKE